MRHSLALLSLTAIAALSASPASAVVAVFSGQDDGAAASGPFPNSAAAEAAFLAAAGGFGAVATETFESQAPGYYSPVAVVGGSLAFVAPNFGSGYSGISNTQIDGPGTGVFGFNVTAGGDQWFGFPSFTPDGIATFTFFGPTNSFGFYSTGVQTAFTAAVKVVQNDGNQLIFDLPVNISGGASYFGITDTVGFTSVSIINTSVTGQSDAWGIDNISYNVVPEPATWAMLITGFGLVGLSARRRRNTASQHGERQRLTHFPVGFPVRNLQQDTKEVAEPAGSVAFLSCVRTDVRSRQGIPFAFGRSVGVQLRLRRSAGAAPAALRRGIGFSSMRRGMRSGGVTQQTRGQFCHRRKTAP